MNVCSASKDIYNFKMLGTFGLDEGQELTNVETQREAQEVGQCLSWDQQSLKLTKITKAVGLEMDTGSEVNYKPKQQWCTKYKTREEVATKNEEEINTEIAQQLHRDNMISTQKQQGNNPTHQGRTRIIVQVEKSEDN